MTEQQIKEAVLMIETKGMSHIDTARHFGIVYATLNYHFRKNGLRPRRMIDGIPVQNEGKLKRDKAMEMYLSGSSDYAIAKHFGIKPPTVYQWRKKHNLPAHYDWYGQWKKKTVAKVDGETDE